MAPSKVPKPTEEMKDYFASIVPNHPAVNIRPMFGQISAFVNGNMFMGIFGDDILVWLPEAEREEVLGAGGRAFEPMPGRPMREYVVLPEAWREEPERLHERVARSLDHAEELPPKQPQRKASKTKKR